MVAVTWYGSCQLCGWQSHSVHRSQLPPLARSAPWLDSSRSSRSVKPWVWPSDGAGWTWTARARAGSCIRAEVRAASCKSSAPRLLHDLPHGRASPYSNSAACSGKLSSLMRAPLLLSPCCVHLAVSEFAFVCGWQQQRTQLWWAALLWAVSEQCALDSERATERALCVCVCVCVCVRERERGCAREKAGYL